MLKNSRWLTSGLAVVVISAPLACQERRPAGADEAPAIDESTVAAVSSESEGTHGEETEMMRDARNDLLDQLEARGDDFASSIYEAMRRVPRHLFVPADVRVAAYEDRPLPIGYEVTISQPYVVAYMTHLLALEPGDRVLEIGTGSGYQAAVLGEMGYDVYTIEIIEPLALETRALLRELGFESVHTRIGDGYAGLPEEAPFDGILLTAAPEQIPGPLLDQLAVGGRLVAPVGPEGQTQFIEVYTREESGEVRSERLDPVRFVPMTGRARDDRARP